MEQSEPLTFGTLLRRYRGAAGLTQEELAERSGLTAQAIGLLERGHRQRPHPHTVQQLADALALVGRQRASFEAAAYRAPHSVGANDPAAPPPPSHPPLPTPPTALVGRHAEVNALSGWLAQASMPLVTLTGPGGVGKTRLALEVAIQFGERFIDGVAFVNLAALRDSALVPGAVAEVLGIRESQGQGVGQGVLAYLAEKRLLLLLDNFEQVVAAAPWLAEVLATCPALRMLVTSRTALRLRGEREFPVLPLPLPHPAYWWPVDALARNPAVDLFVRRAQAVRPDFALTAADAPSVAEIVRRLDGLPLAIELAAARVKVLPLSALLARLERRLDVLVGGARDLPERQQTLRRTLAWSCELLDAEERALFRRLAVFAGGCDLEAAEQVCAGGGIAARQVLDLLARLIDHSLVQAELAGMPRYWLLETTRAYASEQLEEAGEAADLQRRHCDWCLALAERAESEWRGPRQVAWLERLELEHDNMRAALRCAEETGAKEAELRLAGSLYRFWEVRGHWREGQEWLRRALAGNSGQPTAARAKAMQAAALLAANVGDYDDSVRLLEEVVVLWRHLGDERSLAWSLDDLGSVFRRHGDYERATPLYEESLAIWRDVGDAGGIGWMLHGLGVVAHEQGNHARALALYEEALVRWQEEGDLIGIAMSLDGLAGVAHDQGDLCRALARYEEAVPIKRQRGDVLGLACSFDYLGTLALEQGDSERALGLYEEGLALKRQLGEPSQISFTLYNLCLATYKRGDHERAAAVGLEALALERKMGNTVYMARWLEGWAAAVLAHGSAEQAAWLLASAAVLREGSGSPPRDRTRYERLLARVGAVLTVEAFAAAWAAGRAMTPEQAAIAALGVADRLATATLPAGDAANDRQAASVTRNRRVKNSDCGAVS